jgi:hypothetical protein
VFLLWEAIRTGEYELLCKEWQTIKNKNSKAYQFTLHLGRREIYMKVKLYIERDKCFKDRLKYKMGMH